jgi:hypothetical protein
MYVFVLTGLNAKTAMKKNTSNCMVAAIRYVTKLRILTKMHLEITIPCTIVESPGSVRIMSAAARAASVAVWGGGREMEGMGWRERERV